MTPVLLVVLAGLVFVGAVVQRSVGLGFGQVTAPPLAILWPELVPAVMVLLVIPLTLTMTVQHRRAVVVAELPPALIGQLGGTALGAGLLAVVEPGALSLLVGAMVVGAVALSVTSPPVPPGRGWVAVAGVASGAMSTTAATGGPPLALAYQRVTGPRLRGTLAPLFLLGNVMSLAGLAVVGRVGAPQLIAAGVMLPVLAGGTWAGARLARRLDAGRLRPAVLAVAGASGLVAVVRGATMLG